MVPECPQAAFWEGRTLLLQSPSFKASLLLLLNTILSNSLWKRSLVEGKVLAEDCRKVGLGGLPHPASSIRGI